MLIYNYDNATKEYLFSSEAYLDELATLKAGRDIFIIPAYATTAKVLKPKEGFTQCFDEVNNIWFYVEDHRGQVVYDKTNLSKHFIDKIGPIPNNYLTEKPEPKNKYQIWQDGSYTYPEINDLKVEVKLDLDEAYENKLNQCYKVGMYYIQPTWANIYTNTLIAMQQDELDNGKLDQTYKVLLITDPTTGGFFHMNINSIDKFMPFYKKVKETYKQLTEDYHDRIIKISEAQDSEKVVSLILTY